MKCFVCGEEMSPFMEKFFGLKHLDACRYVRCSGCGLVVAETLYDMPREDWELLNRECHAYQHTDALAIDPRWLERLHAQADVLARLAKVGVLEESARAVDFGAGDGKLSDYLAEKISAPPLMKFDAYMGDENFLPPEEMSPASFDFVITCSVFEHLLGAADVEKIFALLTADGTMALHTLVCEEIPRDPNWFYLQPVHATLWTNAAMKKIFRRYGFKACAYHVDARLWLMMRSLEKFSRLKDLAGFVVAEDFVDYWKGKPYR